MGIDNTYNDKIFSMCHIRRILVRVDESLKWKHFAWFHV